MTKIKDVFSKIPMNDEEKIKLIEVIKLLNEEQNKVDEIFMFLTKAYFEKLDKDTLMKVNKTGFLSKLLDVNKDFLQLFVDVYGSKEPVLFTTLSRSIFELHLILRESMSSDESFAKTCIQMNNAYESFIQKFVQLAERENNEDASKALKSELERISSIKEKYKGLLEAGMNQKINQRPNFEELAKKHNLSDNYDFYYRILSSFLHPSLLYIITTPPKDKTLTEEQIKLALANIEGRKELIKSMSVIVAFDFSLRTKEYIESLINTLSIP